MVGMSEAIATARRGSVLDRVSLLWDCWHCWSWVRALVAIPLVATGGIGTGAAIAAVLVAPADKS
jgi:NAD(P)H-dependent flavin oxidoreductase YrpB (nitropropane dioxygenase family)